MVKDLLKRTLGNARLDYDKLRTQLSHAERVINERPLTVMTEEQDDLIPLTPMMFLSESPTREYPEATSLPVVKLNEELKKRRKLREELIRRFRREYLSLLVQKAKERTSPKPAVGDVVLVGSDDRRRLEWPLGRIISLFPGKDGESRVALVKTQQCTVTRPIQRLYLLEATEEMTNYADGAREADDGTREADDGTREADDGAKEADDGAGKADDGDGEADDGAEKTRRGRQIRRPVRFRE